MRFQPRQLSARNLYRQEQGLRVQGSLTLSTAFKQVKSLSVAVRVYDSKGVAKTGEMKCQYNLDFAKSVLRFDCPNGDCVRGDFDFTEILATAIAERRTMVSGELACKGWRDKNVIDSIHCDSRLRYKIFLTYSRARTKKPKAAAQSSIQALAT